MQEKPCGNLAIPKSMLFADWTALNMEMQPDRLDVAAALVGSVLHFWVHFALPLSLRLRFKAAIFALDLLRPPLRARSESSFLTASRKSVTTSFSMDSIGMAFTI